MPLISSGVRTSWQRGLWQESGAMQRHKILGEAAEAPEIIYIYISVVA